MEYKRQTRTEYQTLKKMKKIATIALAFTLIFSCKKETKTMDEQTTQLEETKDTIAPLTDNVIETAVIYEANIRQYSPEGTFDAFTKDIPQLKGLGVKVIWLMPVFPISETKRKATGGADSKFASEMPEEEQSKYLGSYYAVTDYTKINPEFGTIEDFRELVKTAHENGIYVILDWVPNHTGWDHIWIKEHPEYYTQNEAGDIVHPAGTDWTDVADLNYDNQDMRKEMIEDMMYWLTDENIDGFRCDVAGDVPLDFWEQAMPQLRGVKSIFMLAENDEPKLMKGAGLFDMGYGWKLHHLMKEIYKGEKSLKDYAGLLEYIKTNYESDDILMNFVANHDENSWSGTVNELYGDASHLMTAMVYMSPGMPLIYSGQEYDLDHRLKFFEKDSIPKTKGETWDLLTKLGKLKNENAALNGGKQKAGYTIEETSNDKILKFSREKNGAKLTFIGNFSNEVQSEKELLSGIYLNALTEKKEEYKEGDEVTLQPWDFKILID